MRSFTQQDDSFHFAEMGDRWWMTETSWFSFCNPARKLGGWLYTMVRPNIGTVSGGAWVWDHTAHLPWDVLYSSNHSSLCLPADQDLTNIELPTGVSIRVREPCMSYDLSFADGRRCRMSLRFDGLMMPRPLHKTGSPFGASNHFDQFGRVTGQICVNGEDVTVDCLAMRDRTWGPRPEHRPKKGAYVTGIASGNDAFLAVTQWVGEVEQVAYGFMILDGEIADLTEGRRIVERDPDEGWVTKITIEAQDERGRKLHAEGSRLSGMIINRHSFIDSNGLIQWRLNGKPGHGEDQDMWPVHDWADFRRSVAQRNHRAVR